MLLTNRNILIGASLQGRTSCNDMLNWMSMLHNIGINDFEIPIIPISWIPSVKRFLLSNNVKVVALHGIKSFFNESLSVQSNHYQHYEQLCSMLNIQRVILHPPISDVPFNNEILNLLKSSNLLFAFETINLSVLSFYEYCVSRGITCELAFDIAHLARCCSKVFSIPAFDSYYLHVRGWNLNERYSLFAKYNASVSPWICAVLSRKQNVIFTLEYPYQDISEVKHDMQCLREHIEKGDNHDI